jgi:hypothetical protein
MLEFNGENDWTPERGIKYSDGPILGLYREDDSDIFDALDKMVSLDDYSKKSIIENYLTTRLNSLKRIDEPNIIQEKELETINEQLQQLKRLDISVLEWAKNQEIYNAYKYCVSEIDDNKAFALYLLDISYNMYLKEARSPLAILPHGIKSLYNHLKSFEKYELIELSENIVPLLEADPPRYFDIENNLTIDISYLPKEMSHLLSKLLKNDLIGTLSFRPKNFGWRDGKDEKTFLLEEIERGRPFLLHRLGHASITKLYSKVYQNQVIVHSDSNNLTFEELCDDFSVHCDSIVTQALHFQIHENLGHWIITHFDHEYIFYSEDEYNEKMINPSVKGKNRKRIKTFKADGCSIPFNYKCIARWRSVVGEQVCDRKAELWVVPFVLENYFKHKDLIAEYFAEISELKSQAT